MSLERCRGGQQLTVPTRGALGAKGVSSSLNASKMYKSKGDLPKHFPPGLEENQGGKGWDETQNKTALIIPKPIAER